MRATKYNRYLTITKPTITDNLIGGFSNNYTSPSWTKYVWASVVPVKSYKRMQYAQIGQMVSYEVELRAELTNADIDCQITFGEDNYQIVTLIIDRNIIKMDIARVER